MAESLSRIVDHLSAALSLSDELGAAGLAAMIAHALDQAERLDQIDPDDGS